MLQHSKKLNSTAHLVIIDALNLIRRIDGAIRGFSAQASLDSEQLISMNNQAIRRLIRGHRPSHIVAVFDGDGNNWRKKIYPQYKENRKPMASDLAQLLPNIQQQWRQLGVESFCTEHDEADDLIATLSKKMTTAGGQVTIVSTDQGFYQLLPLGVKVWDHFTSLWINNDQILQKYGVSAEQLLDYWSIVGQSGNKIPGVSGLGPKAALNILTSHHSLKLAFAATPSTNEKQLIKLQQEQEQARLSYQLVKLKTDLTLELNLKDIRYQPASKND
jgi:protein Xni